MISSGGIFDLADKEARIAEIQEEMNVPNFWEDQEAANKLMKDLKFLKGCVEPFKNGLEKLTELEELIELSQDEPEYLAQIEQEIKALRQDSDKLELQTILSGEFDRCNAIFSINSGAGGTESCDWANMLLRMYTRWCDEKGYVVKTVDILQGEEGRDQKCHT